MGVSRTKSAIPPALRPFDFYDRRKTMNGTATTRKVPNGADGHFGDRAFKWLTLLMALSIFVLDRAHRLRTGRRRAARPCTNSAGIFSSAATGIPVNDDLWRAAVHFRHARFVRYRARHRRAHQHRHGGLSHRTRAALAAPAAHHVHRTARRHAQRHSGFLGNFCDGSVAARSFFPAVADNISVFCRSFKARFTASACWPPESSSPS